MAKLTKIKVFVILLLAALGFGSILILVPREYNAPHKRESRGTQYWHLNTGSRIAYTFLKAKGTPRESPVIFLQGGPGGPIFESNIRLLGGLTEDGYNVYLYDQIGCGLSDRLNHIEEYTVDRHISDLEEIIKTIGTEKVILIGQSWGAILAALYIADHPEKVERAIFTGPGPLQPQNRAVEAIEPPDSLDLKDPLFTNKMGRKKAYTIRARVVELIAIKLDRKLASDKEMDDFASILNYQMNKSTVCDTSRHGNPEPGYGYYCMVKTLQSLASVNDRRATLRGCDVPLLILRGQCDGIKWGYIAEYQDIFKNCTIRVIQGAGHSVARENPEAYLSSIRAFLQQQHADMMDR